jgi:DNA-binding NtrC family response regulator
MTFVMAPARSGLRADTTGRCDRQTEMSEFEARDARDGTRLERLIAGSAARFLTMDAAAIDRAIVDCLRQVVDDLQLDRAIVWIRTAGDPDGAACHYSIDARRQQRPLKVGTPLLPCVAPELAAGETRWIASIDEWPTGVDREACRQCGLSSAMIVAVAASSGSDGAHAIFAFGSSVRREWPGTTIERLRVVAAVIAETLARKAAAPPPQQPRHPLDPVGEPTTAGPVARHLHVEARSEDVYRRDLPDQLASETIIGRSKALRRVLDQIQQVAVTDSTVLLLGETGVGKEVLATHLHEQSARRGRAMVRVNCAAIPSTLIESELFGREKGAFTGSLSRQIGRFELADHSTIFLDEIGDLPAEVQVKLLRVLEERQIERLGSPQSIRVDVRIVAATHRKLEERIAEGTFREDLFYRLNVFPIQVPPLRERAEDIPSLVWLFVDEFCRSFGKRIDAIPQRDMDALQRYGWPGNIRELRNVIERAMIVATGIRLTIALPTRSDVIGSTARRSLKLVDVEKDHVRTVLEGTGWRIRGAGGAAEVLGLQPTTLETRMLKLGLHRPRP